MLEAHRKVLDACKKDLTEYDARCTPCGVYNSEETPLVKLAEGDYRCPMHDPNLTIFKSLAESMGGRAVDMGGRPVLLIP